MDESGADKDKLVWEIYKELSENERHFNGLESQYRFLVSTWLLALFAAVGYLLSQPSGNMHLDVEWLIFGLTLVSAVGITLIWNIDLRVYHQLLDACFVQRLELELENKWLPQMGIKMVLSQYEDHERPRPDGGVMARIKWFYILSIDICLFMSGVSIVSFTVNKSPYLALGIGFGYCFFIYFWSKIIWAKTRSPLLGQFVVMAKQKLGYE